MSAYLDHAATTPMRPAAIAAMTEQLGRVGNASSLHGSGRAARRVVEEAREQIAEAYGAAPAEVIFTSGGTEGDNLAVKGLRAADRPRIAVGSIEHHAVLDCAEYLQQRHPVDWIPVEANGVYDIGALETILAERGEDIGLISAMWANNETGAIQPVPEIAALARSHGIRMHTDAVQAAGVLPLDFTASGVDAMTITGHKLGGPVGVGALLLRRDATPEPVLHGGGQERDIRSGTLDVAAIAGFAAAVAEARANRDIEISRITALRDRLAAGILASVPDAVHTGAAADRLPGIVHISFPGCEGDALLMLLDAAGVECSTGSACSAGVARTSHVLTAMGVPEDLASGSLRFSLGHTSTVDEVEAAIAAIGPAARRARAAGARLALSDR
ncbi:MAG TPA: cysteine desulfurase family protein [Mycobacteriales bacterium]|nr:cysteine desulfurase family protein [Mycobacteriales bacterium]